MSDKAIGHATTVIMSTIIMCSFFLGQIVMSAVGKCGDIYGYGALAAGFILIFFISFDNWESKI